MTRISLVTAFGGAAALMGALVLIAFRSPEPVYQGQRLGVWLAGFSLIQEQDTEDPAERSEASADAVRRIGTNALPVLLELLQSRDSVFKRKLMQWAGRQSLIDVRFTPASDLRYRAIEGFAALGPQATGAIPRLEVLLRDERTCAPAAAALARIGPAAIPSLAQALTNHDAAVRHQALVALSHSNGDGRQVIPILIQQLGHPDPRLRATAAEALGRRTEHPRLSLPALFGALRDPDPGVCAQAVRSLGQYREHTAETVPALLNVLRGRQDDLDPSVPLDVLRKLAPAEPDLMMPFLISKLDEPDSNVRLIAVMALGRFGRSATNALPRLRQLVDIEQGVVLREALRSLAEIDPDAASQGAVAPPP